MQYGTIPDSFVKKFEEIPYLSSLISIRGVYLAGGLLRTLINPSNESPNSDKTDIDLFFYDQETLDGVKMFLGFTKYEKIYQCPEGKLASYVWRGVGGAWRLQLISVAFYKDITALLDSFDFTCTMFGISDVDFVCGDTSLKDTQEMHLVWNKITYPASSLRRMAKYIRKGYWMQEEDYQHFVEVVSEHRPEIIDEALVYVD